MSHMLVVIPLNHALGIWPPSSNRLYRINPRTGQRFNLGAKVGWEGVVSGSIWEELEALHPIRTRDLLTAEGWRVRCEWIVWSTHRQDVDNWHKATQDACLRTFKDYGTAQGWEVNTDHHVTHIEGERLLPPKRRRGEPKRDYLLITITPRTQRQASRALYDVLAETEGTARNAAVEKLSA